MFIQLNTLLDLNLKNMNLKSLQMRNRITKPEMKP